MYLKIDNYKYLLRIYVDILKYMEGRGKRILINVFFFFKEIIYCYLVMIIYMYM